MNEKTLFEKVISFTSAVHLTTQQLTKDVKNEHLTSVQYAILEYITVSQPVTPSEISECLHISLPNTSRELRKLLEQKWIIKETDAVDRRKQVISLSTEGTKMMSTSFQKIEHKFQKRIEHLTAAEKIELEQALDLLQQKLFYD